MTSAHFRTCSVSYGNRKVALRKKKQNQALKVTHKLVLGVFSYLFPGGNQPPPPSKKIEMYHWGLFLFLCFNLFGFRII